ncbi:MAG: hypothetical protein AAGI53_14585 [Planctomycetota bacterium]
MTLTFRSRSLCALSAAVLGAAITGCASVETDTDQDAEIELELSVPEDDYDDEYGEIASEEVPSDIGTMLIEGLMSVEGCEGVRNAEFDGGQSSILAWFRDREALSEWYYHPVHQRFTFGNRPKQGPGSPMYHVPEDVPVLVIASITPKADAQNPLDVDQISIELFTPLPGGAMLGGRMTPMSIHVPHMMGAEEQAPAN